MKFYSFIKVAILATFVTLVASCTDDNLLQNDIVPLPALAAPINDVGLQLHPETEITTISDNQSHLNLPDGVQFVYTTTDKRSSVGGVGEADVTCTCNTGSGCDPVLYDNKYTCVMKDGCSNCSKSTSLAAGRLDRGKSNNSSVNQEIVIHGLVDYNKGITFVTHEYTGDIIQDAFLSTQEETYGNAFPELFDMIEVQKGVKKFLSEYYDENIPDFLTDGDKQVPNGYTYIMVNVYGNLAALPFPSENIDEKANRPGGAIGFDGKVTCTCLSAGDGCKYDTAALGKLKYCDSGDCTSCKLSN